MYNEQLEKLIEMALMDSELTEKEKQVLFKKAETMGVDLDEFEMVLEAKLYEKQHSSKQTIQANAAPKSDKFGDVKKCPACGAMVQSFQTKCPECEHEFSNVEANASIEKLFKMLNDAENERQENKGISVGKAIGGVLGKMYGIGGVGDKINNKKMEIIKNFPVPTTKDDILEFLSLAVPNAKKTGNLFNKEEPEIKAHNTFVPVWKSKCEQIIMKAKFSMKDDKNAYAEIKEYAKELKIKVK
jgi:hypothetical protein